MNQTNLTPYDKSFNTTDIINQEPNIDTIIWAIVNGLIFVSILGGNILVVIAVRSCRRLRSIISNLFILSLAMSDILVGLMLPYHLTFYIGFKFGQSYGLCLIRFFFIIFACCVSILTLITIAVDRYIAILYSLHYRRFMTRRTAIIIITFNWILGAIVAVVPMFWNHWDSTKKCEFNEILPVWYIIGLITPGFLLIWITMSIVYWKIMREASKHVKQQVGDCANNRLIKRFKSEWKSLQIVLIIMGCFSVCWFPYFFVACFQLFEAYKTKTILYRGVFSLAISNSGINPIIYCWKNSNFRKAFAQILRCKNPNQLKLFTLKSNTAKNHSYKNSIILPTKEKILVEQISITQKMNSTLVQKQQNQINIYNSINSSSEIYCLT